MFLAFLVFTLPKNREETNINNEYGHLLYLRQYQ